MTTVAVRNIQKSLVAFAFSAIALIAPATRALAQEHMLVSIPFAFHNGSQRMPAGVYTVDIEQSMHSVLLRGESRSGFVMVNPTINLNATATGKLVFEHYGDEYFLREVWPHGSTTGQRCVKSRQEKEVERAGLPDKRYTGEIVLAQLTR